MMFSDQEEESFNMALSKFESMLKSNKILFFDSEEFENIVLHYLDSGKINLSKKALKLGLEQHPDSIGLMLVKVELMVFENKIDEGFEITRKLKKLDPNNEEVYIQEANLYSKKGLHAQAIKSLDVALKFTDSEEDVFSLMAMEYLYMDELGAAKHFFTKCLKLDPYDQSALYNVVYCYDFLNLPFEAIKFLEDFIDENPYSEVAWHQLGKQYVQTKDYQKAIQAFDFAYVVDEYFVGALIEKAKVYEKIKAYKKAILTYRESLEIDNESAFVYWRIGRCYEKLGKNKKAALSFIKSIKQDVLFEKSWLAIIDLYVKVDKLEKASLYLSQAVEVDDENPKYWEKYVEVCILRNDWMGVEVACRQLVLSGDYSLKNWTTWADASLKNGAVSHAVELLLKGEEHHPNSSEIDYRLAGLYFIFDEKEKSIYRLQNAMMSDINSLHIFENNFPEAFQDAKVQQCIADYKKRMND